MPVNGTGLRERRSHGQAPVDYAGDQYLILPLTIPINVRVLLKQEHRPIPPGELAVHIPEIAEIEQGVVHLRLSKEQVKALPAIKVERGWLQFHAGDRQMAIGNVRVPIGGDIIIAIGGEPVTDFEALNVYLETRTQVGDRVKVTVIRDGQEMTVEVTLGERPDQP